MIRFERVQYSYFYVIPVFTGEGVLRSLLQALFALGKALVPENC